MALALSELPLKPSGEKLMRQGGVLLVTGSRLWEDSVAIALQLALLVPVLVIHGDCEGADELAGACARAAKVAVQAFPVDPSLDGEWPAAGPRRDARMVKNGKPTQGLALGELRKTVSGALKWTGTGTTVSMMLKAGLVVRWIRTPGSQYVDLTETPK